MPRRLDRLHPLAPGGLAGILVLLALAVPLRAEVVQTYKQRTLFEALPEASATPWSKVGSAPSMILEEASALLLNDNDAGDRVAYQSMVGRVEASHRVRVQARVKVVANSDGDAALIELSRPGLEVLVRLRPDRIDVLERLEGRQTRWLGSAAADLTDYRLIEVEKAAIGEGGQEVVRVLFEGEEILSVQPQGGGELDVGRILMGSLSYPGYGASLWRWIEVELWRDDAEGSSVSVETPSVGSLKSRWSGN